MGIVGVYVVLATLYAVFTPAWQAPDEPAHYNYVRYLAERHRFPVLVPGDYPAAYLEEIKAARFPAGMSIEPIRYEFHQPPLYYLVAVPVYGLFGGALLPLRLLSVVLGAVLLGVIYQVGRVVAPTRPALALGATAFVAFLPMHLATTASVNNDTLAELLLATGLLLAVRYCRRAAGTAGPEADRRLLVLLGITTGLGLLTKSSVYVALPLGLAAVAVRHLWLEWDACASRQQHRPPSALASVGSVGLFLLPAIAVALPWWGRNAAVYGGLDLLGLGRHEAVVAGQLTTAEFVAANGWRELARGFATTSFRSFWGQFGWMGVLLDQRLYQAAAILSALAVVGFGLWAVRLWRGKTARSAWQWAAGGLLALAGLLTAASYVWYNTSFVQHQGRYLFPALAALGLAAAAGWSEALRRWNALPLAGGLALAAGLRLAGLVGTWPAVLMGATAATLALRRFLPERWDGVVLACPYLVMIGFGVASLFLFIVPQLSP